LYYNLYLHKKFYSFCLEKAPFLWDIVFHVTNNKFYVSILEKIILLSLREKLKNLFNEYQPDIIISTHPSHSIVEEYKKEAHKNIFYLGVITDSYIIHQIWISKSVDYYCVIDEDTKHKLMERGISKEKIYVTGFPVNSKLFEKVDRQKILVELGLKPDKFTILVVIDLTKISRFIEIVKFLGNKTGDFQIIIITGKYQNLYELFSKMKFVVPAKIIGWTDLMHDFMRISDLVICKAGGAIVSEALSAKKLIFIPVFAPGQEKGNAYVIKKYGMGFYETDINKIYTLLNKIIYGEINLKDYEKNIEKWVKFDPAYKISQLVNEILSGRI
jgi:processive 1,2-diacylglycerol beta-glucosyltransferase